MREFMNVVESQGQITPEFLEQVRKCAGGHGLQVMEPDWYGSDDVAVVIPQIVAQVEQLFANGPATLYRALSLPEHVLTAIAPGASLGPLDPAAPTSWTSDFSHMDFDSTYALNHHEDEEVDTYLFTAKVPRQAVALPETVAQRLLLPWEQEIVTKRGVPVKCIGIAKADNYGNPLTPVRRDLVGKMMTS